MAAKKNSITTKKISIEDAIQPLLGPLTSAIQQAQWNGIGGASHYVDKDNGRIASLGEKFGTTFKQEALRALFMHIVDATANVSDNPRVLKHFVLDNPDILLLHAKKTPEYFHAKQDIARWCGEQLAGIDKKLHKQFGKLIKEKDGTEQAFER